jgi:hypothetical protein
MTIGEDSGAQGRQAKAYRTSFLRFRIHDSKDQLLLVANYMEGVTNIGWARKEYWTVKRRDLLAIDCFNYITRPQAGFKRGGRWLEVDHQQPGRGAEP